MTDEHALLAAIAANPDDDTVRLAYADFLDEQGDEVKQAHAEYIRIQIGRQRSLGEPWDSARESQLYLAYHRRWWPEITGFEFAQHARRGFPCRASAFISAVLAAAANPLVRIIEEFTVTLDGAVPWRAVLRDRLLAGLTELTIRLPPGVWSSAWAMRDFDESEFPWLERLTLNGLFLDNAAIGQLCAATGFPRLQELDLRANAITDDLVDQLIAAPLTRHLHRLRLGGNQIGPEGVRRLSARFGPVFDG